MALTTYAELKTSIGDWLNRSDLTAVIPDFISLAEAQIERTLRARQMIVRANASFDAQYGAVPSDFLEAKSLKLTSTNPQSPLSFLSIDALDAEMTKYTGSGKPKFFGVVGGQLRIVPTPDATYTTELTYYAKLAKLSNSNTSNWLLASSPDIYLYGALLQAAPYLQDDARIQTWATLYERALNDLQTADDRGASSGGALLTRAKTFG
jgi:hypothetical protein